MEDGEKDMRGGFEGEIPSGMRGSSLILRDILAQPFSFMNLLSQALARELPGGRGSSAGGIRTRRRQRTTGWCGPPTILVRPCWAISILVTAFVAVFAVAVAVVRRNCFEVEVRRALRELTGDALRVLGGGAAGFQRRNADAIGWISMRGKSP